MTTRTVFCSASDHDVALVSLGADFPEALARGEVACLENGVRCTGTTCPYCAGRASPDQRRAEEPSPRG